MAKSISQQVAEFLKAHPTATNTDLYRMFPKVRENTLRNYKYKFKNSVDQYRSTRKKTKSKKTSASPVKSESQSLRKKVFDFFQENPKASNQRLYEEFAQYSKNKLRHYKSSYFKTTQSTENKSVPKPSKKGLKSKPHHPLQQAKPKSLETRVTKLEEQVDYLNEIIIRHSGKSEFRSAISGTAIGIEKKVKELEETIAGFINARRKKIKTEMSNLEEIQQLVSDKISSFIKGFK